jgi:hypothetical protein
MVVGERVGSRTIIRILLGAGNVVAVALLVFPYLDADSLTSVLREAPHLVKVIVAILAVLCVNGVFLALSIYCHSILGHSAHWLLRLVNALGACFSVITTYMAFSIGTTRAAAVMGVLVIVFAAHAVLLQKTIGHS